MAGSHPDLLRSPSELREEAARLLNTAIGLESREIRKQLLVGSFELIQRAEKILSQLNEGPNQELLPAFLS